MVEGGVEDNVLYIATNTIIAIFAVDITILILFPISSKFFFTCKLKLQHISSI